MIVTTTPMIEGKRIVKYRGIVTGEAIMGANIVRDIFASISDIEAGAQPLMRQSCPTPGVSPCRKWNKMPPMPESMRWWGWIWITK
jgi:hypothetical protein